MADERRIANLEVDVREIRRLSSSTREIALTSAAEIAHLHEAERSSSSAARVVQLVGLCAGVLGVVGSLLVIVDAIFGLWS